MMICAEVDSVTNLSWCASWLNSCPCCWSTYHIVKQSPKSNPIWLLGIGLG